ncbi:hypothetical protein MTR67_021866 [Solanum verrucosum]|uniref:Uncharacterized protein n=1 Tax=Solanum verrucosum TaxID=315347 RepID=A0AAF0QXR8_SOLVR|nr:hypothetical protein MTR67_021866 [Solanum verrucosum]
MVRVCVHWSSLLYLSDTVTENSSIPSAAAAAAAVSVSEICKRGWNLVGKEGSETSVAYLNWSAVGGSGGLL